MRTYGRDSFGLAALAACSILASGPGAADTSYHIGNSLTYDMYVGGLEDIARGFGISLTAGYHIRNASSLVVILNNPSDASLDLPAIWPTALPAQPWNFLTFEPFPDPGSPSTLQSDVTAAQTFINLVPKTPGAAPAFFVYEAWPSQVDYLPSYSSYWNQAIPDGLSQRTLFARQYFDALHQRLTAIYGDSAVIHVIPVGDVIARIDQRIAAGQFPDAISVADFYRDVQHMGTAGKFIAAITTFATMYHHNPAGAFYATLAQRPLEGSVALTPQVAAELESIVWEVVTSDSARTGVYPMIVGPSKLEFAETRVGEGGQPQTTMLSNVTALPLAIDDISVPPDFRETNTCGASLPANSQCTITVTFAPGTAGAHSGMLTIRSAGGPYTVSLSGSAQGEATISSGTRAGGGGAMDIISLVAGFLYCLRRNFPRVSTASGSRPDQARASARPR